MIRISLTISLVALAFLFPWWVTCLASFIVLCFYDYAEIVIVGALLDALYGSSGWSQILFSLSAFLAFASSLYLKPKLAAYNPL